MSEYTAEYDRFLVFAKSKNWFGDRAAMDLAWFCWQEAAQSAPAVPLSKAATSVLAERKRQLESEGWTPEHDDEHAVGEMAIAAACYALASTSDLVVPKTLNLRYIWRLTGWSQSLWKPKEPRRNLIRAAALLIAEIERLDRAQGITGGGAA